MLKIDSLENGIVIDHIKSGNGMKLYNLLGLDKLDCCVAVIKNAKSNKYGKKDIIKIDSDININTDVLGYVDPGVTVSIIKNGVTVEKKSIDLPERLTDVILCKNPRCITSTEQELPHIFTLTDKTQKVYRCMYCETKAKTE